MKSRRFILALLVLMLTVVHHQLVSAGSATLTDNVFNDVVVAVANFDTDGDSDRIDSFITTLKNLLQDTSETMYSATDNRLSFGTITLLLPPNWKNRNATTKIGNLQSSNIPYNTQTLNTADIIIDITNVAYYFMPYTQQSGFCGERGDFIHISYLFINGKYDQLKYGSPSKLLAREWVKYFFGVYDEQGYNYDYMYPVKYFSPQAEPILNLCNTTHISWFSYSCGEESDVQGLPASCDLTVDKQQNNNASTSMMSLPLVPVASKFCSKNYHNSYAPNKQNIMCDGKSVMEIILQNSQVKESFKFADVIITVEQQTFDNTLAMSILCDNMDTETTTYSVVPSLSKFIQYDFPLNAWFSLQESAKENVTQPWTQINSDDDRLAVLDTIANVASESQDISLMDAFDNLITSTMNMTNNIKVLLVVTAGDISSANWTYMCETAADNNCQLRLISYSSTSVENFLSNDNCMGEAIQIQKQQCPDSFTVRQDQVDDCCVYLQQRKMFDEFIRAVPNTVAPNLYQPPQTFYEELLQDDFVRSLYLTSISDISDNFLVNRFYYETCENMNLSATSQPRCTVDDCRTETIECDLDSNQTQTYCADQVLCLDFLPIYINCYDKFGKYPYLVYVVGQPNNSNSGPNVQPINLYSWTVSDYSSPFVRVRLFARLVIGTSPIFNALVQATIFSTNQTDVIITLRDDGSGNPDISAGDGVYSAYFTQHNSNSVYTVTVTATDQSYYDGASTYPTRPYPWISGEQSMELLQTGPFTRVVSAGSFYINPSSKSHVVPPGRIMDLQVNYSTKSEVGLQWTTPGQQLDFQQVDGYYLKCSIHFTDINDTNFNPFTSSFYSSTQSPGSKSQHVVYGDVDGKTHYCSIITCNSDGFCASPSNIATYSIVFPSDRHYRIVLWTSIGIVIVILLAVGTTVVVLYRKEMKFTSNRVRETTTRRSQSSTGCDDAIPMECFPNELRSRRVVTQNLDLPPSYEDVIINPPIIDSDGGGDHSS